MIIKEGVVHFESPPEMYVKEESGDKSNTVRALDSYEYNIIQWAEIDEIQIENTETQENFRRKVTDMTQIGGVIGIHLVVFSWRQKWGAFK